MAKKKISYLLPKNHSETRGILLLVIAFFSLLSLLSYDIENKTVNWIGIIGHGYAWTLIYLFGLPSYLILGFIGWVGWKFLLQEKVDFLRAKAFHLSLFLFSCSILLSLMAEKGVVFPKKILHKVFTESIKMELPFRSRTVRHNLGGVPFYYLYRDLPNFNLQHLLSDLGVTITFTLTAIVSFLFLTEIRVIKPRKQREQGTLYPKQTKKISEKNRSLPPHPPLYEIKKKPEIHIPALPEKVEPSIKREEGRCLKRATNYQLPPPSLLTNPKKVDQPSLKKELRRQAEILEESLKSFGIAAKVKDIHCGPTIVSFEVHPAIGVKVHKITALENDIALNLQAKSIRIIAPIPGKAAIGIEIPSPYPQEVSFKELLLAYQQGQKKFSIPIILGKTVMGENVISDLSKMPHCLIAGATGSGKSVCINTIIMSILMNARPDEVKLIMIDPKKVELAPYTRLPHLLAPVITEPHGAYAALNWLVKEMLKRYDLLKQFGLRNIEAFNSRQRDEKFEATLNLPSSEIPEKMPLIVAIIDEFADLMMASSSNLETPIARIAQMARAVGIHLILATQRPSREVITGLIKANFPVRIAFKVASRINSQIILDENGAETLLGNGDQLFRPPGSSHLIRSQNTYVSDEDIKRVIEFIYEQEPSNHLISSFDSMSKEDTDGSEDTGPRDLLYEQAKTVILETKNASTTFLQRKLKIGYARAASLMDELETNGVISAQIGSKARKVLIESEE